MVKEGDPLVIIDTGAVSRARSPQATANARAGRSRGHQRQGHGQPQSRARQAEPGVAHAARRLRSARAFDRRAGVRGSRAGADRAHQPRLRHHHRAHLRPRRPDARARRRARRAGRGHAANYHRAGRSRSTCSSISRRPTSSACSARRPRARVTLAQGNLAEVRLLRADGSLYDEKGTLDFSDYSVNPTTGAVAFRGRVANPNRVLLPGMYVNVRLTVGTLNKGFRVPQLAVQRDGQGPYVLVVGADGKVAQKRVETVVGRRQRLGHLERPRRWRPGDRRQPAEDRPGMPAKATVVPAPGARARQPHSPPRRKRPASAGRQLTSDTGAQAMPQFFIDRPVFAWVIAILITLGGVFAIRSLPAEAYPDVAPPQVSISATYPGANADVVERTVIQVIEQQLTGIDNLMYFSSSSSNGARQHHAVFETGTDPGHRGGADAEPRRARRAAAAARRGAAGPAGREGELRLPHGREPAIEGQQRPLGRAQQHRRRAGARSRSRAFPASARRSSSAPNTRCASG